MPPTRENERDRQESAANMELATLWKIFVSVGLLAIGGIGAFVWNKTQSNGELLIELRTNQRNVMQNLEKVVVTLDKVVIGQVQQDDAISEGKRRLDHLENHPTNGNGNPKP